MGEKKSLYTTCKEASYEDFILKFFRPVFFEFAATLVHTFWGSMIAPRTSPDFYSSINRTILPGDYAADYVVSTLMPALQAGFAVWMIIVFYQKLTIIHFNPIMSLSFAMVGFLSPYMLIPYVTAQLFGSATGAWIAQSIKGDDPGPFRVAADANVGAIVATEVFNTGVMVIFALAMTLDKTYDQATGPMAIGFTVFQAIIAGKWVGSSCLNPSRAFGPALVLGEWDHHWVWWVGPAGGSVLFTIIYMLFFAPKDQLWILTIPKRFAENERPQQEIKNETSASIGNPSAIEAL